MAGLAIDLVEIEIAHVRPSLIESLPATVLLGRRHDLTGPNLALTLPNSDAHFLLQEIEGRETPRSQAIRLTQRVVAACGSSVSSVQIRTAAPGLIRPWVQLATPGGIVDVPSEPAQALALSVVLGVPLLADVALFPSGPLPVVAGSGSPTLMSALIQRFGKD